MVADAATGKISRYFYGLEYSPRDLRLGLVEASENKIGTLADQVMLLCFQYDPMTGKYGFAIMRTPAASAASLTLLALGGVHRRHVPPRAPDRTAQRPAARSRSGRTPSGSRSQGDQTRWTNAVPSPFPEQASTFAAATSTRCTSFLCAVTRVLHAADLRR